MNEAERLAARFRALITSFLGVASALPKTIVPASPGLSRQCQENVQRIALPLTEDAAAESIAEVGRLLVKEVEDIARSNKTVLDDVDATMKDVVATVAEAISGFRGHGERHESSLTRLADGFEALSHIEDVTQLRRRLREDVGKLRQSVEAMRRESEESAHQFETRISTFQQRLEAARKGSDMDRLTLLGSRRAAENYIRKIPAYKGSVCLLLFDIDGFRQINERFGTPFGDKLLQALAHVLTESFPEDGSLFRWGADEFLAIAPGALVRAADRCRHICDEFANRKYVTYERGAMERVSAAVSWGAVQYVPGQTVEVLCRQARESLERNQREARR